MDIVQSCAKHLHTGLCNLGFQDNHGKRHILSSTAVINVKVFLFNACTFLMISSLAHGIFETMKPRPALLGAGFFFLGRQIADASFSIALPHLLQIFPGNLTKPQSALSFNNVAIFYHFGNGF